MEEGLRCAEKEKTKLPRSLLEGFEEQPRQGEIKKKDDQEEEKTNEEVARTSSCQGRVRSEGREQKERKTKGLLLFPGKY